MEKDIIVRKGKSYICIEDWKKLGTSFTKGKIYVCHKDRCMYDDFGAEKASVGKLFRLATKEELGIMDKDIRKMTLGEVEDLILKQHNKVVKSHYWLFDKKNKLMNILLNLNECVLNLEKNQKFITDDEFIDGLIKDFQKEPKF